MKYFDSVCTSCISLKSKRDILGINGQVQRKYDHVTATEVFEDGAFEPAFTRGMAFIEEAHARTPRKGLRKQKHHIRPQWHVARTRHRIRRNDNFEFKYSITG